MARHNGAMKASSFSTIAPRLAGASRALWLLLALAVAGFATPAQALRI